MSQFVVNFGIWDSATMGENDPSIDKVGAHFSNKFPYFLHETTDGLVYYADTVQEAKKVQRAAIKVITKAGFPAEVISIGEKPHCPKCGFYRRFSDTICPDCQIELVRAL